MRWHTAAVVLLYGARRTSGPSAVRSKCKYRVVLGFLPQSPLFMCSAGSRERCLLKACEEAFFRGHTTERLMVSRPTPEIRTRSTSCGASGGRLQIPCSRGWLLAGVNITVALATFCATNCVRHASCGPRRRWPHHGCYV